MIYFEYAYSKKSWHGLFLAFSNPGKDLEFVRLNICHFIENRDIILFFFSVVDVDG
jgi:hypothetical protein